MWGNMTGWMISLVLVAAVISAAFKINSYSAISDATELSTGENLEPLVLPVSDSIVDQSTDGDAGQTYRAAASAYNEGAATTFMKNPAGTVPSAIAMVLEATHKSKASIFSNSPSDLLNYDNYGSNTPKDSLSNLKNLGQYVISTGIMLKNKGNPAEARRYIEAGYALGWNLCKERLTHDEYREGLVIMENGLQYLVELTPANSDQKAALEKNLNDLKEYDKDHVQPIYDSLSNINLAKIDFHAGDRFRFATKAKDRMIQDEAILSLGNMRFDVSSTADQTEASKYLDKLKNDSDPIVATAAKAARDLTEAQYNGQSHMPP